MNRYLKGPTTERLELRALTAGDAAAFYRLNSDPEVMRFTGEPPLESLAEARVAIAEYPDFDSVGFGRWGCVLRGQKTIFGFCGLKYLPDLGAVDVGYRFLPEYWGRGFATEACAASIRFGFDTLELERIIAMVLPENTGSIRVLEKVGMRCEGRVDYEGLQPLRFGISPNATRGSSG